MAAPSIMDGTAQLHFSQPEAAKAGDSTLPGPPAPQSSVLHEDDASFFVSPRSTTFVDFTWVPRGPGAPSPAGRSWSRSTSTWSARSSSRSTSCGQGYGSYSSHGCGSFSGRRARCATGPGGAASLSPASAAGGATCAAGGSLGAASAGVSSAVSADIGDVDMDACVVDVDMGGASVSPTSPAGPRAANPAAPAGPAAARPHAPSSTHGPPAVEPGPAAAAACAPPPAPASTTSTSRSTPAPTIRTAGGACAGADAAAPPHQQHQQHQLEGTAGRCASGPQVASSSSQQHEACAGPPGSVAPTPSFRSSVPTAVPTFIPTLLPLSVPSSVPSSSLPTPTPTSSSGIHINTAVPSSVRLGSSASASSSSSCNSSPTGFASIHVSSAISSPTSISPRSTKPPASVAFNVKMPPRPAKRSADGSGASDDDASASSTAKLKLARSDRGPEDFSSVVKNRLQSYTRTGQACDRCKVRKIRCDALPEGCSHCINLNLDCYVTDRVTGRTERRGYMQQLEREKSRMMSHIRDLERLCAEKNVEVKPFQGRVRAQSPPDAAQEEDASNASANVAAASSNDGWCKFGSLWIKDSSTPDPTSSILRHKLPRNEWQTRPEQSRWGVGSDDAPLSSLKGMTLTLLGTTIETTSFDAPDVDEPPTAADPSVPLYNKSVQAFLRSAMRVNPAVQVELPTRENAFIYAEWYFITIASFMPLLHKPTFMKLLTRVYDEPGFKPTVPEMVLVHMVFAIILFQFGVRNSETLEQRNNFNDLSNKHYHFALSKMYEVFSSADFEALQGLVLIASHTRAFPKPGCGSIVASMALHRAIELNYHRRTKKPGEPTDLQNELRKRAWWNMMMVVVDINGKRGYPLPVSVQDFDVDFPEPIADELLSDEGVDTSRTVPCPYEIAIAAFKCIPIYMEMYANIFSVRRDESNYKNVLAVLEAQMKQWEADLPESMRLSPAKKNDHGMVGALFARTYMLEFRLHIRHPSLAMTTDAALIAENTKICEEAAREYLQTVEHLSRMKALDTTWHQMSLYCVAILSMLVPQWQRRFEITQDEVARLRDEMQRWMNIVREMSALLGCGTGMSTQIAQLINRTMSWIEHDMPQKDGKNPILTHVNVKQEHTLPSQGTVPLAPQEQQQHGHAVPFGAVAPQNQSFPSADTSQAEELTKNFYHANITAPAHATYPSLAYMDQQTQPNPQATSSYQHDQTDLYYPSSNEAAGHPGDPAQTATLAGYGSEAGQHICHQNSDMMWRSSWQNWSAAIAESQQRYGADSLMTLGDAETGRNSVITPIMAGNGMPHTGGELPMVPQPTSWPLIMFDQTPRD